VTFQPDGHGDSRFSRENEDRNPLPYLVQRHTMTVQRCELESSSAKSIDLKLFG
jgi:hypothetical protein